MISCSLLHTQPFLVLAQRSTSWLDLHHGESLWLKLGTVLLSMPLKVFRLMGCLEQGLQEEWRTLQASSFLQVDIHSWMGLLLKKRLLKDGWGSQVASSASVDLFAVFAYL